MKTFSITEHNIIKILESQTFFRYDGKTYRTVLVGKPSVASGEPKTDIYWEAINENDKDDIFVRRISFKQANFDFVENKISKERAREIFGDDWSEILRKSVAGLEEEFNSKKLIFRTNYRKTEAGCFTLGWKFELLNKGGTGLSRKISLSDKQLRGVYAGTNLGEGKRDASVGGKIIISSGVADAILVDDGRGYDSAEDILTNLINIDDYVEQNDTLYFACKALNYRSFKNKYDGDRPLGVYVKWSILDGKLHGKAMLDEPLEHSGDEIYEQLKECLEKLGITDTDDVSPRNTDFSIVFDV